MQTQRHLYQYLSYSMVCGTAKGKEQTMIYRLDYFMYGKWTTWGFYEDADEAQDVAFEHQRVYGSEGVRVVPIPKYVC